MNKALTTQHFEQLIGLERPWRVRGVEFSPEQSQVEIHIEAKGKLRLPCPECGRASPRYDVRERRWRHLDTMQYATILIAQVPRVRCEKDGVRQVDVPWAERGSRFTALFEAIAIDWLQSANLSTVAKQFGLTWDQVAGIQERAVRRGLARRSHESPRGISVDETSFARGRDYVTVVSALDGHRVLYVADERRSTTLEAFYEALGPERCAKLEWVVMDMWDPYIKATKAHVPNAEERIVFDKFHIAQYLTEAVDHVRRQENRELRKRGDDRLSGTRYLWLYKAENLTRSAMTSFAHLRQSRLKVAKAWLMKEVALSLWGYVKRGWAVRMWNQWLAWVRRSRIEPMKRVGRTIQRYFYGVANAASNTYTNAGAEGLNGRIQAIKRTARGFRNRERFRNAIYFHFGGLDLYPK